MATTSLHTIYDWQTGSTWIADGPVRIARIEAPRLRNFVLRPGEAPLNSWLTLFWWQYANNENPGRSAWIVDQLTLDDRDPELYALTLLTHNDDRTITSQCRLELTFDEDLDSYRYDIDIRMKVSDGARWAVEPQGGVEFANPWFIDSVGSSVDYPEAVSPRWKWVLYTNPDGEVVRLPLNHLGSPPLERIRFPERGGWLGFFNQQGSSPIIEIKPDTAASTRAEVCAWGYDVHFIRRITPAITEKDEPEERVFQPGTIYMEDGQTLSAHYCMYALGEQQGGALLSRSRPIQLSEDVIERYSRPAFNLPLNTFQNIISPQDASNAWYWTPSHADGLTWDREQGRMDSASLRIENKTDRLSFWEVPLGKDFWMAPLHPGGYRVKGWIRTQDLVQGGAYLSFRYSTYEIETGQSPKMPENETRMITGTEDWSSVELPVEGPPSKATRAYLRLVLKGKGKAWFDDVSIENRE